MPTARVVLVCGFLLAAAAAPAPADEVDDLLAGKSVATQPSASPANRPEPLSLENRIVTPLDSAPLAEDVPWDASIGPQPRASLTDDSPPPSRHRKSAPSSAVNLVPEPSAIILATLALLYFLIFFRRRRLA